MREAHIANVVGAMALLAGDGVRAAAEASLGAGALPAAIATLGHHPAGRTIEQLAGALGVSHSRTVRVVDRLEHEGMARRAGDPDDRRSVRVTLTPCGHRALRRLLTAREDAVERLLAPLDAAERRAFAALAAKVLAAATTRRPDAHAICRLCDSRACGHAEGLCPVTRAADAAEALAR